MMAFAIQGMTATHAVRTAKEALVVHGAATGSARSLMARIVLNARETVTECKAGIRRTDSVVAMATVKARWIAVTRAARPGDSPVPKRRKAPLSFSVVAMGLQKGRKATAPFATLTSRQ